VPICEVLDVSPANRFDFDPFAAGSGDCVSRICLCAIGEEDDNEMKWEVLRTILLASCQNRITNSQDVLYTQHDSRCIWPQVAEVSSAPRCAISRSDVVCLFTEIN